VEEACLLGPATARHNAWRRRRRSRCSVRLQPDLGRHRQTLVVGDRRSRRRRNAAAVLRSLKREAEARERLVRLAQPGTVLSRVGANRPLFVLANPAHVELQWLPRAQALPNLIRKRARIARDTTRVLRDEAGGLMVAMAVARVALEACDHDERSIDADDADDVAEDVLAAPLHQRFLEPLREAVVDHRREVLSIETVVLSRLQQFFG